MTNHPNRGKRYRVRRVSSSDGAWIYWRGSHMLPSWTRDVSLAKSFTKSAAGKFLISPRRTANVLYEMEEIT